LTLSILGYRFSLAYFGEKYLGSNEALALFFTTTPFFFLKQGAPSPDKGAR
jgi:hypothetical protein